MKTVTSTRIVLDKDEREVRHAWVRSWSRMRKDQERRGGFYLLFGDWSGYHSGQQKMTHCEYLPYADFEGMKLRTVEFSDSTTMSVWAKRFTIEQLLAERQMPRYGYTSLIAKARQTGESYYKVTAQKSDA